MSIMNTARSNFSDMARRVLVPYWFEITSGIFVGLSMVLIFVRQIPVG